MINKVKLGENDLRKPACSEYCKMGAEHCPFSSVTKKSIVTTRWTDDIEGNVYIANFEKSINTSSSSSESLSEDEKYASPQSCWCDGSGFEHDILGRNLIGPSSNMEGIY